MKTWLADWRRAHSLEFYLACAAEPPLVAILLAASFVSWLQRLSLAVRR